jgi:hypothetical protein
MDRLEKVFPVLKKVALGFLDSGLRRNDDEEEERTVETISALPLPVVPAEAGTQADASKAVPAFRPARR